MLGWKIWNIYRGNDSPCAHCLTILSYRDSTQGCSCSVYSACSPILTSMSFWRKPRYNIILSVSVLVHSSKRWLKKKLHYYLGPSNSLKSSNSQLLFKFSQLSHILSSCFSSQCPHRIHTAAVDLSSKYIYIYLYIRIYVFIFKVITTFLLFSRQLWFLLDKTVFKQMPTVWVPRMLICAGHYFWTKLGNNKWVFLFCLHNFNYCLYNSLMCF
jgi:hypothetical protein